MISRDCHVMNFTFNNIFYVKYCPKLFFIVTRISIDQLNFELSQGLNPSITYNGVTGKILRDKAEIFNSYFSSVFQKSTVNSENGDIEIASHFPIDFELSEIFVSEEEVINYLRIVDSKSHGPDEIHPRLLKVCCEQIGPSLFALFNHSLVIIPIANGMEVC